MSNNSKSKIIYTCGCCGKEITNESDIFKMFTEVGPTQYWHKECAEKHGFDTTKQNSGWLSQANLSDFNLKNINNNPFFKNIIIIIIMLFLLGGCVKWCVNASVTETKDFEDITNKELQQFLEWQDKQRQKE